MIYDFSAWKRQSKSKWASECERKKSMEKKASNKRNTCLNECNKYLFSSGGVFFCHSFLPLPLLATQRLKKPCTYCVLMRAFPNGCTHVMCRCSSTIDRITKWKLNGRKMTFDLVDMRTRVNFFSALSLSPSLYVSKWERDDLWLLNSMGSRSYKGISKHTVLNSNQLDL